jgi:hypothetical protein
LLLPKTRRAKLQGDKLAWWLDRGDKMVNDNSINNNNEVRVKRDLDEKNKVREET